MILRLRDWILERRIRALADRAFRTVTEADAKRRQARELVDRMVALCKQRSDAQVARMEHGKGLR